MKITLKHLESFAAVAREGSFTRAARRLALSQPALTITINQFEDIVGVKLFDRTTRRVSLTPLGAEFLPTAERLLADFQSTVEDVRAVAQRRRGRVNVATLPSFAVKLMPEIVKRFTESYPAITVHLHDSNASGVHRRVLRGEVDFGLSSMWEPDQDLAFEPLLRDSFGLVCRRDHPLATETAPLPWAALAGHRFLGLAQDTGIRPLLHQVRGLPDDVRAPQVVVSNVATLEGMLAAGVGVTVLPELAVPDHHRAGFVFRHLVDPPVVRETCLITRRGRSLTPAAESMREHIVRALAEGSAGCGEPACAGD